MEFILETTPETGARCCSRRPCRASSWRWQKNSKRRFGSKSAATKAATPISITVHPMRPAMSTMLSSLRFFDRRARWCSATSPRRASSAGTLSERGFLGRGLSGELTQNERTHALRRCATDAPGLRRDRRRARHRSAEPRPRHSCHSERPRSHAASIGRTAACAPQVARVVGAVGGNAALKCCLICRHRCERGTPPQADEIRKLDQERMLKGCAVRRRNHA